MWTSGGHYLAYHQHRPGRYDNYANWAKKDTFYKRERNLKLLFREQRNPFQLLGFGLASWQIIINFHECSQHLYCSLCVRHCSKCLIIYTNFRLIFIKHCTHFIERWNQSTRDIKWLTPDHTELSQPEFEPKVSDSRCILLTVWDGRRAETGWHNEKNMSTGKTAQILELLIQSGT